MKQQAAGVSNVALAEALASAVFAQAVVQSPSEPRMQSTASPRGVVSLRGLAGDADAANFALPNGVSDEDMVAVRRLVAQIPASAHDDSAPVEAAARNAQGSLCEPSRRRKVTSISVLRRHSHVYGAPRQWCSVRETQPRCHSSSQCQPIALSCLLTGVKPVTSPHAIINPARIPFPSVAGAQVCTACKCLLKLENFSKYYRAWDGLKTQCKRCVADKDLERKRRRSLLDTDEDEPPPRIRHKARRGTC